MLYIIGIGLNDEKDITLKGLEAIKKCDLVYLENYTSKLNTKIENLEKLYGKKIILADRALVENSDEIINNAKEKNVAFLVIGDALSATTHINLILEANKKNIKIKIIHNASILTAVGITGLQLYNFGKTTSIPLDNDNIKTPIEAIKQNQKNGLHTLCLLDIDAEKNRLMTINEAIDYLIKNKISKRTKAVVCCAIGSEEPIIKYDSLENLKKKKISEKFLAKKKIGKKEILFDKFPQCLIIPGKLHFIEKEMLELFAK